LALAFAVAARVASSASSSNLRLIAAASASFFFSIAAAAASCFFATVAAVGLFPPLSRSKLSLRLVLLGLACSASASKEGH
jgi:hypothetical protein